MSLSDAGRDVLRRNGRRRARQQKKAGFFSSKNQSKRRKGQIKKETGIADQLVAEGYEIYSPTVVCDRIAVKDGKVLFVEFKKPGQALRPGQQRIHDLVPLMYLIRYE